jgi:hypothetical protein
MATGSICTVPKQHFNYVLSVFYIYCLQTVSCLSPIFSLFHLFSFVSFHHTVGSPPLFTHTYIPTLSPLFPFTVFSLFFSDSSLSPRCLLCCFLHIFSSASPRCLYFYLPLCLFSCLLAVFSPHVTSVSSLLSPRPLLSLFSVRRRLDRSRCR